MVPNGQAKISGTLTERDRYWLGHHEACEKSTRWRGQSARSVAEVEASFQRIVERTQALDVEKTNAECGP